MIFGLNINYIEIKIFSLAIKTTISLIEIDNVKSFKISRYFTHWVYVKTIRITFVYSIPHPLFQIIYDLNIQVVLWMIKLLPISLLSLIDVIENKTPVFKYILFMFVYLR